MAYLNMDDEVDFDNEDNYDFDKESSKSFDTVNEEEKPSSLMITCENDEYETKDSPKHVMVVKKAKRKYHEIDSFSSHTDMDRSRRSYEAVPKRYKRDNQCKGRSDPSSFRHNGSFQGRRRAPYARQNYQKRTMWNFHNMHRRKLRDDIPYRFIFVTGYDAYIGQNMKDYLKKLKYHFQRKSPDQSPRNTFVLDAQFFDHAKQCTYLDVKRNDPLTNNMWDMLVSFIQGWSEYQRGLLYKEQDHPLTPICDWIYQTATLLDPNHPSTKNMVFFNFSPEVVEQFFVRYGRRPNIDIQTISMDKDDLKYSFNPEDRDLATERDDSELIYDRVFTDKEKLFKYVMGLQEKPIR